MASIPHWRARVYTYAGGEAEASFWYHAPDRRRRREYSPRGTSPHREANRERALRRARSRIRRLVMAAGLDHLLTLTYRENMQDLDRAERDLDRFLRKVRRHLGKDYPYVVVFERQKRGAIHWHLAVKGFQHVHLLRRLWREVVGEGNVDVQYRRSRHSLTRQKLVYYLCKYITKAAEELPLGRHRYRASLGIEIPRPVERAYPDLGTLMAWVTSLFVPTYHWRSDDGLFGWMCSW